MMASRLIPLAVALAWSVALGACERTAKVETPTAEAEVSTKLPQEALSDAELNAAATNAAVTASMPSANATAPIGADGGNNLIQVAP